MGIKSWIRAYLKQAENRVGNKPGSKPSNKPAVKGYEYYETLYKKDMSEPFITFYSRVKSGDIPWTVRDGTVRDGTTELYPHRSIYTFIVNEDTIVEMFRSQTDMYSGLWQKHDMFTFGERVVLSEYLKWYEYNKIQQEKEQRMQDKRNKLSKALGLPIDNLAT